MNLHKILACLNAIQNRIAVDNPACLNKKEKRLWAAVEAAAYGRGGFNTVCLATGLGRGTLSIGIQELKTADYAKTSRARHSGGGRKKVSTKSPDLVGALEKLVDPIVKDDPESHLRWCSKSARHLTEALKLQGYSICPQTTVNLLHNLGYSLQVNQKSREGFSYEDRDNQFRFINSSISGMQNYGQPTISVDTKKKELIGNFKNSGQEYRRKKSPLQVNGHDFPDPPTRESGSLWDL